MMSIVSDENVAFLRNLISDVLSDTNCAIEIEKGSSKGDGYLSTIYSITATSRNEVEEQKKCFIAKVATNDEETRKKMSIRSFFLTEVYFYDKVMPVFYDFQKRKGSIAFDHVAKCYATRLESVPEILVFEDLKQQGFDLWNRRLPMPESHIKKILELYGNYHAVSVALRDQEPKTFEVLKSGSMDALIVCLQNYSEKTVNTLTELLKSHLPYLEENSTETITDKYRKIIANWQQIIVNSGSKDDPKMVFCHGDTWCNNIMFKVKSNKPQ